MSVVENRPDRRVSTGLAGLDTVLDELRIGDNVVWRVGSVAAYRRLVKPFVAEALSRGRGIIYMRFADHPPLVEPGSEVEVIEIEPSRGFEAFSRQVHRLITDHGRGAFYVFDCLSELLAVWATDIMVGNFFRVTCPYLYELDTVAYFALLHHAHSHTTTQQIRGTTQVLIDVHQRRQATYVHPIKVAGRQSPTMFLPHAWRGQVLEPVVDSGEATRLQRALHEEARAHAHGHLDYWDRLFLQAGELPLVSDPAKRAGMVDQLSRVMISRDERILAMARRLLTIEDLLGIRSRMIGTGYLGGKAVGMILARKALLAHDAETWRDHLEPHDSYFVGSDVYYSFLVHNGWWNAVMRQRTEAGYFAEAAGLRRGMLAGQLPPDTREELARMLDYFGQYPILIRSSSLLEDGFGNAFAGKYESCFRVNQGSPRLRMEQLEEAIRRVYASAMSDEALSYRHQRGLAQLEEPMALLIQRVSGRYRGDYYMPDAAGVAVSRNTFAWDPSLDASAGMVRLVMGLGTRAVDRIDDDHAAVIALDAPGKRPFRDSGDPYRYCQNRVDLLNIPANQMQTRPLRDLVAEGVVMPLRWCAEVDRRASQRAEAMGRPQRVWRLTFDRLLSQSRFVPLMRQILGTLEAAYGDPVDVEFTLHLSDDGQVTLNLVQCRPLQTMGTGTRVEVPVSIAPASLLFATRGHFMGGNMDQCIDRVIVVDPASYDGLNQAGKHAVARLIGRINRATDREACPTMLMGPGRWGSSTPELGVPVRFNDFHQMTALVEVADMGRGIVPDLSFGSHFFLDMVESRIAYVALLPQDADTTYHPRRLDEWPTIQPATDEARDDEPIDRAAADAVRIYDTSRAGLRLLADVRDQRLVCCTCG